jgi:hypothetical protein
MPKLSAQAEALFNIKKEDPMVKKDEVMIGSEIMAAPEAGPGAPIRDQACLPEDCCEMVVDSPKKLWDAIGHIQFKHVVTDWEDAMNYLDQVVGFWAGVEEHFKELFEVVNKASPAQLAFLKRLYGDKYTDEFANLSKEEASAKIEEEVKLQDSKKAGAPASGSKPAGGYDWKAKKQAAPAGPAPKDENRQGATDKQLGFAETLAKRQKINLPEDYKLWSVQEASAWIKEHTAQK